MRCKTGSSSRLCTKTFSAPSACNGWQIFSARCNNNWPRSRPTDGEAPLVALLTPGPYNETYFEHVFLARYLGFPLVEGSDLTVRDNRVYLKTLQGLKRVHVLLRRLDDEYCDPAALRTDSTLGVAGLISAARAGHIVIANALGSRRARVAGAVRLFAGDLRKLAGRTVELALGGDLVVR